MGRAGKFACIAALASALCAPAAGAARTQNGATAPRAAHSAGAACPSAADSEALLAQASAMLQQGQLQPVITLLEPASGHCDPRIDLLLAGAFEGSGNLAAAEGALQRAHARWPANTSIAVSLAREYLGAGDTGKAVAALADYHPAATAPPQELKEAALVFIAGHKLVRAMAAAQRTYQSDPSLETLLLVANVLQLQGRYKDVNRFLAGRRAAYGSFAPFLITAAESEYDAMLYDAAQKDLNQAIAIDPNAYQAHFLLGNVYEAENLTDRAAAEYRITTDIAPEQPRAYYQLALIAHARQDDAGEQRLLEQSLAADKTYAPAHCEMGRLLVGQHHYDDAVTQLNLAIEYNPQTEQAYYLLARAYAALGETGKSDAMVKRYDQVRAANRRSATDTRAGQLGAGQSAH